MLGRDYSGQNCSVARGLEVVGERWTLLIVRDAFLGVADSSLPGAAGAGAEHPQRRLEMLADAGVLERQAYQERPPRYEYLLTERGLDLFPVILGLSVGRPAPLSRRPAGPSAPPRLRGPAGAGPSAGACGRRWSALTTWNGISAPARAAPVCGGLSPSEGGSFGDARRGP